MLLLCLLNAPAEPNETAIITLPPRNRFSGLNFRQATNSPRDGYSRERERERGEIEMKRAAKRCVCTCVIARESKKRRALLLLGSVQAQVKHIKNILPVYLLHVRCLVCLAGAHAFHRIRPVVIIISLMAFRSHLATHRSAPYGIVRPKNNDTARANYSTAIRAVSCRRQRNGDRSRSRRFTCVP